MGPHNETEKANWHTRKLDKANWPTKNNENWLNRDIRGKWPTVQNETESGNWQKASDKTHHMIPVPYNSKKVTQLQTRAGHAFLDSRSAFWHSWRFRHTGPRARNFCKARGNAEREEVGTLISHAWSKKAISATFLLEVEFIVKLKLCCPLNLCPQVLLISYWPGYTFYLKNKVQVKIESSF